MLKSGDHCTSPQSIDFAVMEVKEYDEIYNVMADQMVSPKTRKMPCGNKAKKFAIRDDLLYYCDKKRGERQVGDVCVCVCVCVYVCLCV